VMLIRSGVRFPLGVDAHPHTVRVAGFGVRPLASSPQWTGCEFSPQRTEINLRASGPGISVRRMDNVSA
jgi:hypothetical protein